jgi:hypothetical protein
MHHGNDNAKRTTAAIPLALRLARQKRAADLRRLISYGTVPTATTWLSADGDLPEAGKPLPDRVTELRPSPDEVVRIAARTAIAARDGVGPITPAELDAAADRNTRRDARGAVTHWRGSDGKWRLVAELFRQPKGQRRKSEAARSEDNAHHLALRGSGTFPVRAQRSTTPSAGEDYRRLRAAHWVAAFGVANDNARVDIDRAGVGALVAFDRARANAGLPPVERGPTVIAPGAEFLAFRVHSNPRATPGSFVGPASGLEDVMIAAIDAPRNEAALGDHARVLDLSIAGATAKEIALTMGWDAGRQGERKAVAAQDAALVALEKMAA